MTARRFELDWLRVIVFGLLIFYHVSMYFNPWWWHIKSPQTYDWMKLPLLALNQWRLEILFVISGMGTYFSLCKRSGLRHSGERLRRLGLPLIFGMLVIVPPQVYIERVVNNGLTISYWEFLTTISFQGFYPEGNITWNHLWFLPYLLCYSLLLVLFLFLLKRKRLDSFLDHLKSVLENNPWKIYLFIIPILLVEATLSPFFPVVPKLIGDWYAFSHYFLLFSFGFIFMHIKDIFFETCFKLRRKLLLIAALVFWGQTFCFPYMSSWKMMDVLQSTFEIVYLWSMILTIFGYATKYLSHDSRHLKYLNEAVYPFYILHQTILMLAIYWFRNAFQSDLFFFLFLVTITLIGSWVLFELVRRVNILRPFFGLKGKFQKVQTPKRRIIRKRPGSRYLLNLPRKI